MASSFIGLFEVVVHWKGSHFKDEVVMSNKITDSACHALLANCILNANAPAGSFSGVCDGSYFTRETAAEVLRAKLARLEFPGDAGQTVHLYPELRS